MKGFSLGMSILAALLLVVSIVGAAQDVHITPRVPVKSVAEAPAAPQPADEPIRDHEGRPLFRVRATRQQLYTTIGTPSRCLAPKFGGAYPFARCAGLPTAPVLDIYALRTRLSEYEVQVVYDLDSSESRLHPAAFLKQISFRVDKRMSVIEVAEDLAELRELCRDGCVLRRNPVPGPEEVIACPPSRAVVATFKLEHSALAPLLRTVDSVALWDPADIPWICSGNSLGSWRPAGTSEAGK